MDVSLFLTKEVVKFRNSHSELIAQWERQLCHGNCHPDLYFCRILVNDFPKMKAYLAMLEYRIGFAINAYIVHANWQRDFIESGYDGNLALELANHEIQLTYKALDGSKEIAEHPKGKVYHDVFSECYPNNF